MIKKNTYFSWKERRIVVIARKWKRKPDSPLFDTTKRWKQDLTREMHFFQNLF